MLSTNSTTFYQSNAAMVAQLDRDALDVVYKSPLIALRLALLASLMREATR